MISTVIHILVLLISGINNIDCCLNWDYDRDSIRFICNTEGSRTVRLVDNHGEDVARCVLNHGNGSSGKCSSFNSVKSIIRENSVTFRIDRKLKTDLIGNWSCLLEDNQFMAEVLTSTDLTKSTTVNLFGKIVEDGDYQRLLFTCSSCRIPKGKHVEFLVNNSSEDIITFNNETGKCTSSHGECTSSKCNCSSTGTTFGLFLLLKKQMIVNTNFSCEMKFEDKEKSIVFSKVPTLSFNGKEFKYRGTRTIVTKITDVHSRPNGIENEAVGKVTAGISTIIVLAIIITVAVYSYNKRKRCEKKQKEPDEGTPLIDSNKLIENKSVCTYIMDIKKELELFLGKITDKITGAETRFTNERSEQLSLTKDDKSQGTCPELELSLTKDDASQRTCPELEEFLKILKELKISIKEIEQYLKKLSELQTTITSGKEEETEIDGRTHDKTLNSSTLADIHEEPDDICSVKTPDTFTSKSTSCSIEQESRPHSESNKDVTDANNEMDNICPSKTLDRRDTTLSVPSSQTEPSNSDNQSDTKAHSLTGEMFDVLFLNCDTQFEKNWVLKALDVLENNHNLNCGCAEFGDDYMG